jgi:hypothetical protein
MALSPAARAVRERLFSDFEFYARNALMIRTKDQKVVPLELNTAQRKLLEAVNDQLGRRGFCRLTILKGRQMGSSTFVEAFLYWWVSQRKAQRALVVAHDAPASATIFNMTKRFHEKCPEILRPSTRYSERARHRLEVLAPQQPQGPPQSYVAATSAHPGRLRQHPSLALVRQRPAAAFCLASSIIPPADARARSWRSMCWIALIWLRLPAVAVCALAMVCWHGCHGHAQPASLPAS